MSYTHLQKHPGRRCCSSCEKREFDSLIHQGTVAAVPYLVKCSNSRAQCSREVFAQDFARCNNSRAQCSQEVFAQGYYDGLDHAKTSGLTEDEISHQHIVRLKGNADPCVYDWDGPQGSVPRHRVSSQMYPSILRPDGVMISPQEEDAPRKGFGVGKMECYGNHDGCDGIISQGYKIPGHCSEGGGNGGIGYSYYSHGHPYVGTDDPYLPTQLTPGHGRTMGRMGTVCDGNRSSDGMTYPGKSDSSPLSNSDTNVDRVNKNAVQTLSGHSHRASGPYYSSKGPSCAVLLNMSPEEKSDTKGSRNPNVVSPEDIVSCCKVNKCDTIDSSRSDQGSPHRNIPLGSPLVPVRRAVESFRPIMRGRQPSFPAGRQHQISFFSDTVQVAEVYSMDHSSRYTFQIYPKIDRGFFMADNGWTCYRRNYFQVSAAFNAKDQNNSVIQLPCLIEGSSEEKYLYAIEFELAISARVSKSDENKRIVLVQHTPKRDRGPQVMPQPRAVRAGGELGQCSSVDPGQLIVTFERLQFKTATANNGRRRAAQQYYTLTIELLATVRGSQKPELVAYVESAPLVVRGRSPGHYSDGGSASTSPSNPNCSSSESHKLSASH